MCQRNFSSQRLNLRFTHHIESLAKEISAYSATSWVDHVNHSNYEGEWSVLPLRSLSQHRHAHPIRQGFALEEAGTWCDLSSMEHFPSIIELLSQIPCDKKSVRLMRLGPYSEIKPHRDRDLNAESGEARLHVPVLVHQSVHFISDGKTLPMNPGDLWYINADRLHSVENHGKETRIHLVVDCVANSWLCSQLAKYTEETHDAIEPYSL